MEIFENFEIVHHSVALHQEIVWRKALVMTDSVPKITSESSLSKQSCLKCRLLVCQSLSSYDLPNFDMSPMLVDIGHTRASPPSPKIRTQVLFLGKGFLKYLLKFSSNGEGIVASQSSLLMERRLGLNISSAFPTTPSPNPPLGIFFLENWEGSVLISEKKCPGERFWLVSRYLC